MDIVDALQTLTRGSIWGRHFTLEDVTRIAKRLNVRTYQDGAIIFRLGDEDHSLCFLVSGNVIMKKDYPDQEPKVIVTLAEKTLFGEVSLADNLPRSATAEAKGQVTILCLQRQDYLDLLQEDPALGVKLQQAMLILLSRRLRLTTLEMIRRM